MGTTLYTLATGALAAGFMSILGSCWAYRKKRLIMCRGVLILAVMLLGVGSASYYFYSISEASGMELNNSLNRFEDEAVERGYHKAVDILAKAELSSLDKSELDIARRSLFEAKARGNDFADAEVLEQYADVLWLAARHETKLDSRMVAQDKELCAALQKMPANYAGVLAGKVNSICGVLLAMQKSGDRLLAADAQSIRDFEQAKAEGKAGRLKKGDTEREALARLGQPVFVRDTNTSDGNLKQYAFVYNGHNVYVFCRDGEVIWIEGLNS